MTDETTYDIGYIPGESVAIVLEELVILADVADPRTDAANLSLSIHQHKSDDLMTLIMGSLLSQSKDFGIIKFGASDTVILLRGGIVAQIVDGGNEENLDPGTTTTWLERHASKTTGSIVLTHKTASGQGTPLPLVSGTALASTLKLQLVPSAGIDLPEPITRKSPKRQPTPSSTSHGREEPAHEADDIIINGAIAVLAPEATQDAETQPSETGENLHVADVESDIDDRPNSEELVGSESDGVPPTEELRGNRYANILFGSTIHRAIEEAAVRAPDEPGPPLPIEDANSVEPSTDPVEASPAPMPESASMGSDADGKDSPVSLRGLGSSTQIQVPATSSSLIIDDLPWNVSSPPPSDTDPATSTPPADVRNDPSDALGEDAPTQTNKTEEEETELTINRAKLQRLRAEISDNVAAIPQVQAVFCPDSHPNPPAAVRCRICDQAVVPTIPATIPRPPLGRLVMSTGEVFLLDRPVLLGRDPSNDRLINGETPHIVRIYSPEKDVSRNHAEIQLDGWRPILIDLQSVNGTKIAVPGYPIERLRPGNRYPLQPGSIIILTDEITLTFDVAAHG